MIKLNEKLRIFFELRNLFKRYFVFSCKEQQFRDKIRDLLYMLKNEYKTRLRRGPGNNSKFLLRSLTYFKYPYREFVVNSGLIFAVN